MIRIVLASHGDYAAALLGTSALLVGEYPEVFAFGLQPGDSIDEFLVKIRAMTDDIDENKQLIFLCDMYGGTPFNVCNALSLGHPHIRLVYGINLPILMETLLQRQEMDVDQLAEYIVGAVPQAIGVVRNGGAEP